jgi:hypothetical protein
MATDFPASACLIYSEKGGGSIEGIKKPLQVMSWASSLPFGNAELQGLNMNIPVLAQNSKI